MKTWLVLFLSLAISPALLTAAESIGQVVTVEGQASATGADGKERRLELKSDIFLNDKIVTGAGAKIQIRFADDTEIFQGEKSDMTIDEYVYDPKGKKESSCSVKMAKGVFRTITGTITDMNPERFKVQTKMATIGIRGCELGFRLKKNKEDIYVINLPEGDSIIIEKLVADETGKGGLIAVADRMMNVVNEGISVAISPSASLSERPMSPADNRQLMQDSTPSKSAGGGVAMDDVSGSALKSAIDGQAGKGDENSKLAGLTAQATAVTTVQSSQGGGRDYTVLANFEQPTTAPSVAGPAGPTLAGNGGTPMNDWEWGLWSDGSASPIGPNTSWSPGSAFLTSAEYQTLTGVGGIAPKIFTIPPGGFGDVGAVVTAGGYQNTLSGSGANPASGLGVTSFEVEIGNGAIPRWGGTFKLSGSGGDSLVFVVDRATGGGAIDGNGNLTLNSLQSYTLVANTVTYSNPDVRTINANLIKPGGSSMWSAPISGAVGTFRFDHGSSASVRGAFGVDLQ